MQTLYIIGQTAGATMSIYICETKEEAKNRAEEQKRRFPLLTVYSGETNINGLVIWDRPTFHK